MQQEAEERERRGKKEEEDRLRAFHCGMDAEMRKLKMETAKMKELLSKNMKQWRTVKIPNDKGQRRSSNPTIEVSDAHSVTLRTRDNALDRNYLLAYKRRSASFRGHKRDKSEDLSEITDYTSDETEYFSFSESETEPEDRAATTSPKRKHRW